MKPAADKLEALHGKYNDTFVEVMGIVCKHVPLKRLKEQIGWQWVNMEGAESAQTSDELMTSFWKELCIFPYLHELGTLTDALGLGNAQRKVAEYQEMQEEVYRELLAEDFAKLTTREQVHDKNVKVMSAFIHSFIMWCICICSYQS